MLQALSKTFTKSQTVLNTHKELQKISDKVRSLSLRWIKAHVGHDGNELADEYAKQGAAADTNVFQLKTTRSEIKCLIETKCNDLWSQKWTNYKHCRQTKNFYPFISIDLYNKTKKLSRSGLSTLIKIVTGQNNLNYLSNIIDARHTELCRFCEEEDETFIHLLNECPVFQANRVDLLKGSVVVGSVDWDPRVLLEFARIPVIADALNGVSNE